jgi:hypothetical protein
LGALFRDTLVATVFLPTLRFFAAVFLGAGRFFLIFFFAIREV